VLEAGFWGFVGGVALLVGAVGGLYLRAGGRLIALTHQTVTVRASSELH
jgi:hypothetical protein